MVSSEERKATIEKHRRMEEKAFALTKEERLHLCDMGFFNDAIRGYLIQAMREADFQKEEIERALQGLRWALDSVDAAQAEKICLND